ncbi:MAG: 3-deoxy-7-phosphoheptulonate synthase, partial [Clostridia bacterium]|nr:3-deoxy-7-phosphoheptulonate synthase [Clostridia bacterium]
ANSGKNPLEQPRICKEVLSARRYNNEIKKLVKGFMIESYIEDGNQKIGEGVYGKSITDACLGWEKTEKLIYDIAEKK